MMKLIALAVILSCYFAHTCCNECSVDEIQTIQQQWTSTFSNNAARLFEFGVAFFLRMMGQGIPPTGGTAGTSRMMAMIGSTIQLLSNPEELQERIEAIRARQNFTDGNSQLYLDTVLQTLPEFVGESYDETAWRDCLTMLFRRLTQSIDEHE